LAVSWVGTEAAEDVRSRGNTLPKATVEKRIVLISPHEVRKKNFRLHFSVIRMGSRGTFVLCTDVRGSML